MIQVRDFYKTYKKTVAVRGISFEVGPGEILGLVGPNGAGKTTTLRALAGIIPPTSGSLEIVGNDIQQAPVKAKRSLAYVPDDPNLFEVLTVWEHMRFVAKSYHVPDFEPKAEQLLADFEMMEKRNTMAGELSRGMKQKVAICCAYLHDPDVLMLDEPLTGLDPRGIRTMKESIRRRAEAGVAVIISSHLLEILEGLCSHLLVIHQGKQLFCGPMETARLAADASLEDVFFRITEGDPEEPCAAAETTEV